MKEIAGKLSDALDSKTYVFLLLFIIIALATVIVAAAVFGEALWGDWFDSLKVAMGGGVFRAATNDGIPKAVEAWKTPTPTVEPPPGAMTVVPQPSQGLPPGEYTAPPQ